MEVGKVKIAEDNDFLMLKMLVDDNTNWKLEYGKGETDETKVDYYKLFIICDKV